MFPQKIPGEFGRAQVSWLTLLLLLAVLVPSICLLWFMNQAVRNERLAARQKLVEAYRGHLTLARERLRESWIQHADDLATQAQTLSPSALFGRQVRAGLADALVCYDAAGRATYPNLNISPARELPASGGWAEARRVESSNPVAAAKLYAELARQSSNTNIMALALRARVRCLVRAGSNDMALPVLTGPLAEKKFRHARDAHGRLVVPDAWLLGLESLHDSTSDHAHPLRELLEGELLDYDDSALAASQRRFLMRELLKLSPRAEVSQMLAAEDLAAQYLESVGNNPRKPGLSASPVSDVWQFVDDDGRVLTLHRTEELLARMRETISSPGLPEGVRIDLVTPGQEPVGTLLSLAAGSEFPGWRLALSLQDPRLFDTAADQRVTTYVWTGALVVATVVVLVLLALGMVRRQAALTQLRNDLVANVTHELKTPLASMRLLVETLLDSPRLHEKTAREYLDLIAKENLRLSRLIDNFLTFSRIERNKYTFDFKEVPAATIAANAAAAVRERFNTPGCRFETHFDPGLPSVSADADAMVTALVNLMDNAWKYSGESKQIALTASAENGSVCFEVRDNGIGLTPRDTKQIFERFFRVDQHARVGGGCGLGLSIVRFIVTAHHGSVRVESEPGRGSTFSVTLPGVGSLSAAEVRTPTPETEP